MPLKANSYYNPGTPCRPSEKALLNRCALLCREKGAKFLFHSIGKGIGNLAFTPIYLPLSGIPLPAYAIPLWPIHLQELSALEWYLLMGNTLPILSTSRTRSS